MRLEQYPSLRRLFTSLCYETCVIFILAIDLMLALKQEEMDSSFSDYALPSCSTPHFARGARQRNRASIACSSCRVSRTKCVIDPGQRHCGQCRRNGVECIILDDDKRRRQASKPNTSSLIHRIKALESLLAQTGSNIPVIHAPVTSQDQKALPPVASYDFDNVNRSHLSSSANLKEIYDVSTCPERRNVPETFIVMDSPEAAPIEVPSIPTPSKSNQVIYKLLSPFNLLHSNSRSGRIQYFGSTTNMHIHFNQEIAPRSGLVAENNWRIEMLVPDVSSETLDYLTNLFWRFHNSIIHLVHKDAFHEDRMSGRPQFYSTFLHFCILSMGFRYADKTRPDIQRLALPNYESTLHKRAIKMAEYELQRPGGIPSVQALFLLGDLECGCGRDDTGWMYGGMSLRLSFDIGLHLEQNKPGAKDRDIQIGYMVMWACLINDKYWSLFLGRPTTVKSDTIEVSKASKRFDRLIACRSAIIEKSLETKVYEALLVLMDIAGKITDIFNTKYPLSDGEVYFQMAALDKGLNAWYSSLPQELRWTPRNVAIAPFSFFLLHQQYHTAYILLHRPFADYGYSNPVTDLESLAEHVTQTSILSRHICLHHATRIAIIFKEHQQRFETRQIFVTALQHAGTACTALIAEIAANKNSQQRKQLLTHLKCLSTGLTSMAETYKPAERMSTIISHFLREHVQDDLAPNDLKQINPRMQNTRNTEFWSAQETNSDRRPQDLAPESIRNATLDTYFRFDTVSGPKVTSDYAFNAYDPCPSELDGILKFDISSAIGDYMNEEEFMSFLDSSDNIGAGLNPID